MTDHNDAPSERRTIQRAVPERLLQIHRERAEQAQAEKLKKKRALAAARAKTYRESHAMAAARWSRDRT